MTRREQIVAAARGWLPGEAGVASSKGSGASSWGASGSSVSRKASPWRSSSGSSSWSGSASMRSVASGSSEGRHSMVAPPMVGVKEFNSNCSGYETYVAQAPDGLFLSCAAQNGESIWVRGDA